MGKIIWDLPLKTVSEANSSEHWTKSSKRHRQQQFFIRQLFNKESTKIELPCTVKMTRTSTRFLDDDNLRIAFKWIRDEISECLIPEKCGNFVDKKGKIRSLKGRADDDTRITWEYSQEKSKVQGIKIEIDFDEIIRQRRDLYEKLLELRDIPVPITSPCERENFPSIQHAEYQWIDPKRLTHDKND